MTLLGCTDNIAVAPVDDSPVSRIKYPAMAAHRGGAQVNPEETVAAFKRIVEDYPGMVLEMDVRGLGDGSLVMWHDDAIDRLADGGKTGKLTDLTREDWEKLKVIDPSGGPSQPAAFLEDVLDEFGGTDVVLMIECKYRKGREKIVEMVWPYRDQVILATFNDTDASIFARTNEINGQHLVSSLTPYVEGSQCVAVKHDNITAQVVEDVHAMGAYLWAWTVDTQKEIDALIKLGVDGIITNDPRLTV